MSYAKQQISLQGHNQDKIDLTRNEGNFFAILRLLAKNNETLNEHLMLGPRNAKYTSKTIQNEILEIAADQVRTFCRSCLWKCPHLIFADKVTSHGKEILSDCLKFLEIDLANFHIKPKTNMKFCLTFQRITGKSIADSILQVLHWH